MNKIFNNFCPLTPTSEGVILLTMVSPQSTPEEKRNAKIVSMYKTGSYKIASLGRIFKLTRQRIHQIVKKAEEQETEGIIFDETSH